MRLPKIGDKLYVLIRDERMYRIGEIRDITNFNEYISLEVDWIINPYSYSVVTYFARHFEDYPTFELNPLVTITFDEKEFIRLLKEYAEKYWPIGISKSNDH